jgi:hypothetical protein
LSANIIICVLVNEMVWIEKNRELLPKKDEKEFAKAGPIKRRKCGLNALSWPKPRRNEN